MEESGTFSQDLRSASEGGKGSHGLLLLFPTGGKGPKALLQLTFAIFVHVRETRCIPNCEYSSVRTVLLLTSKNVKK